MARYLYILLTVLLVISCNKYSGKTPPKVSDGYVDLSSWDFDKDGPAKLDGAWSFYWKEFISPEDVLKGKLSKFKPLMTNVPGSYLSNSEDVEGISEKGYGTYVLKLKLSKDLNKLAIYLEEAYTSYELFIVDVTKRKVSRVVKLGVAGKTKEKAIAHFAPILKDVYVSKDVYLVFHSSNYSYDKGGIWKSVFVGHHEDLDMKIKVSRFINTCIFGIILMMCLYHLGLYSQRPIDVKSLLFAIFCGVISLRMLMTENYINELVVEPSQFIFDLLLKTEYLTVIIAAPVFYMFQYKLFPQEVNKNLGKGLIYISAVVGLINIIVDIEVASFILMKYLYLVLIQCIVILYSTVRAFLNKRPGSKIALGASMALTLAVVNDIFVALQFIVNTYTLQYGLVVYLFGQSYILSKLFADAYENLQLTTKEKIDLQEIDKQKTNFFQNISHELRTPLTLILNPVEDAFSKYKDEGLSIALKNAKRLYRLVNQLLDFQKASHGGRDLKLSPINLNEFLEKVSQIFKEECKRKDIYFELDIKTDSSIYIMGEIDALEKVVFNYFSNAIKYTKSGGRVCVRLSEVEGKVRVAISDTGIGISEKDQKRLFKVFTQVDEADFREYEGTGLGLSLVKELTADLGGEVGVKSELNFGSTFYSDFPIYKRDKRTIDFLIVDDEVAILEKLETILLDDGYEVLASADTSSAKKVLDSYTVKCVVSDLHLSSEESGADLLSYVKEKFPATKRVLITGQGDVEALTEATNRAQVSQILLKPLLKQKHLPPLKATVDEYRFDSVDEVMDLLVVDDEDIVHEAITSILVADFSTAKVDHAFNASEAKNILNEQRVRCVLSDFNLGGKTGVDLLTFVNDKFPETARILMTGVDTKEIPKEALTKAKIQEIFEKPVEYETLKKIMKYVESSNIKDQGALDLSRYNPKDWHLGAEELEGEASGIEEFPGGDGELVLVVDDIKDMRDLISSYLKSRNYRTITARDGEEGFNKALNHKPDLIIADWMMPRKTGVEMIEGLKDEKELAHIPVILLTAKVDDESKVVGSKSGASAYIGKPFDELELVSTVENLFRIKSKEHEVTKLNRELSENVLKRFLPPVLVEDIIKGEAKIDDGFKNKVVTVIFMNICSFTNISNELGSQNISLLLNEYIDEISGIVFEHEGIIDKVMGDSIMAVWGAPVALEAEDQINKAHTCAKAMQEKMKELSGKWEESFRVKADARVGIHHGPAVVGYFGGKRRMDYTAIGATVNIAQRIEGVAAPGEILFSHVVRDILPEGVKWDKAGEYELRGFNSKEILYKFS